MAAPSLPRPARCPGCGAQVWLWTEAPAGPCASCRPQPCAACGGTGQGLPRGPCASCRPQPCAACGGTGQGLPRALYLGGSSRIDFETCGACKGSGRQG
jgi:hypothetical protein